MTKVDIISGFLGAGKTTFIKELLSKVWPGEKTVLIENEFGEIGIDSRFMREAGIEVTEMNSGCICCTLVGDFEKALKKVVETYDPDRIIIEPSGVGKLSDVERAVLDVAETADLEIHGKITVVDGKKIKMYLKNFSEFFKDQIKSADTIVISRGQILKEQQLQECLELVKAENHHAVVITTPWEQLSGTAIAEAIERSGSHDHHDHAHCGCVDHEHSNHCHDHYHHADDVFRNWGIETVHQFARTELEDILKMLSISDQLGTVLRAKGIVQCDHGKWVEFDMVPEEIQIRDCQPDYVGKLCVIGTDLRIDQLKALFRQ